MKAKHLRHALITSAIALVVCIAMLAGSTYAWFTDSVTSTGNVIKAGTLDVEAYYYDYDGSKTTIQASDVASGNNYTLSTEEDNVYIASGQTLSFDLTDGAKTLNGAQMITDENIEPGWSSAKLIQVINKGTLAAKVKINYAASGNLEDALWFDFVQVKKGNSGYYATGTFTPRAMFTLYDFAKTIEISLAGTTSGSEYQEVYFMLVYGMYTDAGNEYQGEEINIDVAVVATQDTSETETDGFGSSSYDAAAEYPAAVLQSVSTSDGVVDALEEGNVAVLTDNVTVSMNDMYTLLDTSVTGGDPIDAVVDVSSGALKLGYYTTTEASTTYHGVSYSSATSYYAPLYVTGGSTLTIIGSGDSTEAELVANNNKGTGAAIAVEKGSSVTLNGVNVSSTGSVLYPSGDTAEVNVVDSTITTTGVYCIGTNASDSTYYGVVINVEGSTLTTKATDCDSCVVMMNGKSTLNISDSYIYGQRQGVIVRAGTATITNTFISCTLDTYTLNGSGGYDNENSYISTMQNRTNGTSTYGTGNEMAMGAVVVGTKNSPGAYLADAVLTMTGCTLSYNITTQGSNATGYDEYKIGLYMAGDNSNSYSTNVTVSDCTINNKVIAWGGTTSYLTYDLGSYAGTVYTAWSGSAWVTGS